MLSFLFIVSAVNIFILVDPFEIVFAFLGFSHFLRIINNLSKLLDFFEEL